MATKSKKSSQPTLINGNEEEHFISNASPAIAVIQENPNLVKDLKSHAVVNRDNSSYMAAVASKHYHRSQRDEVQSLKEKIDNLEKLIAQLLPSRE